MVWQEGKLRGPKENNPDAVGSEELGTEEPERFL